jgi:hypothetical protein
MITDLYPYGPTGLTNIYIKVIGVIVIRARDTHIHTHTRTREKARVRTHRENASPDRTIGPLAPKMPSILVKTRTKVFRTLSVFPPSPGVRPQSNQHLGRF